jgi:hypothetical protein
MTFSRLFYPKWLSHACRNVTYGCFPWMEPIILPLQAPWSINWVTEDHIAVPSLTSSLLLSFSSFVFQWKGVASFRNRNLLCLVSGGIQTEVFFRGIARACNTCPGYTQESTATSDYGCVPITSPLSPEVCCRSLLPTHLKALGCWRHGLVGVSTVFLIPVIFFQISKGKWTSAHFGGRRDNWDIAYIWQYHCPLYLLTVDRCELVWFWFLTFLFHMFLKTTWMFEYFSNWQLPTTVLFCGDCIDL